MDRGMLVPSQLEGTGVPGDGGRCTRAVRVDVTALRVVGLRVSRWWRCVGDVCGLCCLNRTVVAYFVN